MKLHTTMIAAVAATTMFAGAAQATVNTFDSAGDTAGWTVDRYPPATFQSGVAYGGHAGTLNEATAVSDGASNRPPAYSGSFYNTQGMAFNLAPGATEMSIQLYIDPLYSTSAADSRLAGFWGVSVDGANNISAYQIVELDNIGGNLTFQGWDNNAGSWVGLTAPAGALNTGWDTLGISLVGTNVVYSLNGQFAGMVDANGSVNLKSTILQVYNTSGGVVDTAHWDNLVANVPEPTTWALMILGLGGVGASLRRARRTSAAITA